MQQSRVDGGVWRALGQERRLSQSTQHPVKQREFSQAVEATASEKGHTDHERRRRIQPTRPEAIQQPSHQGRTRRHDQHINGIHTGATRMTPVKDFEQRAVEDGEGIGDPTCPRQGGKANQHDDIAIPARLYRAAFWRGIDHEATISCRWRCVACTGRSVGGIRTQPHRHEIVAS